MPGEHWIVCVKPRPRVDPSPRIAINYLAHENKRRAMGKAKKVISDE